jgi:hypothetical protein
VLSIGFASPGITQDLPVVSTTLAFGSLATLILLSLKVNDIR